MQTNQRNMDNKKKMRYLKLGILSFVVIAAVLIVAKQRNAPFQKNTGFVFGTVYNITYQSDKDLQPEIEAELKKVDNSLSTFNPKSIISRINRNEDVVADSMFTEVFKLAEQVSAETDGAFDITVAPLVNAWGFGFKHGKMPDNRKINQLRKIVGFHKVSMKSGRVVKKNPATMLDCSAIAKGYGCDMVARLLASKGIKNYMVEIGGEIVTCGVNDERMPWKIGVTKPTDDSLNVNQELQTVLNVTDKAMATSGNYRNFYYKNGKKYAHTIDPKTGRPVQHNILSATVIADNCATADAYATSFMVLGLDKAKKVLEKHTELMAYFIYSDSEGKNAVWFSPSMKGYIVEK